MNNQKNTVVDVYFNSACPVCRDGIETQKKRSTLFPVNWLDVHANAGLVDGIACRLTTVRKYLHLTDRGGNLKIGIDAFIELWRISESERWKANIIALPVVKQLAQVCYYLFANALYFCNRIKKRW